MRPVSRRPPRLPARRVGHSCNPFHHSVHIRGRFSILRLRSPAPIKHTQVVISYGILISCSLCVWCMRAGAVERAVPELPPPRGGAPGAGAPVAGLLPLPARGPRGAPAAAPPPRCRRTRAAAGAAAAEVPGLHLGGPGALHAATLPRRRRHARRLRALARRRPHLRRGDVGGVPEPRQGPRDSLAALALHWLLPKCY